MKLRVKQNKIGNADHIESINLVYMGDEVIVLEINLKTRNKQVTAFGGASDHGVQSLWIGGDEVQMELPERFSHNQIFAEGSGDTISVCIYRYELLNTMTASPYEDVVLWERPDAKCKCEVCGGARGGVPGNENIVDGHTLCDYCHSDSMRGMARALNDIRYSGPNGELI